MRLPDRASRSVLALLATLALGGCDTIRAVDRMLTPEVDADFRRTQRLLVERRPASVVVTLGEDGLARGDSGRLGALVDNYLRRGEGPVAILAARAGDSEAEGAAARARAERLSSLLAQTGIDPDRLLVRLVPASSSLPDGALRVETELYAVRVPQCGDWSDSSSFTPTHNDPQKNFGCATTRNLGLMINNPRDLVRAEPLDGRDAHRGASIIGKYRAGEDTNSKGTVASTVSRVGKQ
ncbi:MAG: CpaD family pilus assembly lipoprotein [Rhodospirillales bacterium]|nr:CpaD family pilus assembly lipoprotein [Rhodospirillales bacterium]